MTMRPDDYRDLTSLPTTAPGAPLWVPLEAVHQFLQGEIQAATLHNKARTLAQLTDQHQADDRNRGLAGQYRIAG